MAKKNSVSSPTGRHHSQTGSHRLLTQPEPGSYMDFFFDQPGTTPGTLKIEADAPPPTIVLIDYDEDQAIRLPLETPEECIPYLDTESISWIDVQGLGDEDVLNRLGNVFQLHPLMLEDVVNVPQRPKVEDYEDQLLMITHMVTPNYESSSFINEQVSFILGRHYLLTVQEEPQRDCFAPVRQRLKTCKGIIRKQGADYLAYALLDAIIDGFFPVLETYGELIEELEEEVVLNPTRQTLEKIHKVRRELLGLRRAIWPQRDAINSLIRDGSDLISSEVRVYLRDCYDHTIQVIDMVETYRELASSLMDVYLSSVGNKMNEIMKILTVISTIFIPLTFIAGVYGMNFNPETSAWNMPELNWPLGYPLCLGFMLAIAGGLIYYFWRKGWFNNISGLENKTSEL
ncbi:MAG: magnesium/cobalt transporter CorA [Aphanocapsa sp. GSE-SYN-MK-11-07L]|nr:magnesium/cobalt transporter CorA [Aphanocapsa sp. GSE-SYN-MK-11-07L]